MKLLRTWAISALTLVTVISCQKETSKSIGNDPIIGLAPIRTALTATVWEFNQQTLIYGPGDVDTDPAEACKTDERYFFLPNGEATVSYGAIKCNPALTESSGTYANWQLLNNGQILKMTFTKDMPGGFVAGETLAWDVDLINGTKLVIKRIEVESGKTYTVVDTYIKD